MRYKLLTVWNFVLMVFALGVLVFISDILFFPIVENVFGDIVPEIFDVLFILYVLWALDQEHFMPPWRVPFVGLPLSVIFITTLVILWFPLLMYYGGIAITSMSHFFLRHWKEFLVLAVFVGWFMQSLILTSNKEELMSDIFKKTLTTESMSHRKELRDRYGKIWLEQFFILCSNLLPFILLVLVTLHNNETTAFSVCTLFIPSFMMMVLFFEFMPDLFAHRYTQTFYKKVFDIALTSFDFLKGLQHLTYLDEKASRMLLRQIYLIATDRDEVKKLVIACNDEGTRASLKRYAAYFFEKSASSEGTSVDAVLYTDEVGWRYFYGRYRFSHQSKRSFFIKNFLAGYSLEEAKQRYEEEVTDYREKSFFQPLFDFAHMFFSVSKEVWRYVLLRFKKE